MVMIMKFVSVYFDVNNGAVNNMSLISFCAYLLDPATLMFGPWISFRQFRDSLEEGALKVF